MTNPVTLADLVQVSTQAESLGLELAVAQTLGLAVTSWEPLDPSRTILQINAEIVSSYSSTVNFIAQGGFATYAAAMLDSNGNPVTTWMDLLTPNLFNVIRFTPGFAAGPVPVTNSSSAPQSYSPSNPVHFQYPTSGGATYTSAGSGTIPANGSTTIIVIADAAFPGSLGNAATGVILILATPIAGVSVQALTQSLIGALAETNGALLQRCQNKLGTLSALIQIQQGTTPVPSNPSAPTTAYDFVATSIAASPTGSAQSAWPYYVSARITRSQTFGNVNSGIVYQSVANASGGSDSDDVAVVQAACLALAAGQCIRYVASPASNVTVQPFYRIYYQRGIGYTVLQAQTAILNAWLVYLESVPIGGIAGIDIGAGGILPYAEIENAIYNALPGAVDLALTLNGTTSTDDVTLNLGQVAVAASPTFGDSQVLFV